MTVQDFVRTVMGAEGDPFAHHQELTRTAAAT